MTFVRCECLTMASAMLCFFNDEQLICSDLASVFSSAAGRQRTASRTLMSLDSRTQTTNKKHLKNVGPIHQMSLAVLSCAACASMSTTTTTTTTRDRGDRYGPWNGPNNNSNNPFERHLQNDYSVLLLLLSNAIQHNTITQSQTQKLLL